MVATATKKPSKKQTKAKPLAVVNGHAKHTEGVLQQIKHGLIDLSPLNPRKTIDAEKLEEFADGIRSEGILQPLLVRPVGDRYEIVCGERRWRASKIAGLSFIPCVVREMSDSEVIYARIQENEQREDLSPFEEAEAYQQAIDVEGITQTELARRLGKSQGHIANRLRLLKLPDNWRGWINSGVVSVTQARDELLPYADLPAVMEFVNNQLADHEQEARDSAFIDGRGDEPLDVPPFASDELSRVIGHALKQASIPLSGTRQINDRWMNYEVANTAEIRNRFAVRDIPDRYDSIAVVPCAFKVQEFQAYLEEMYPSQIAEESPKENGKAEPQKRSNEEQRKIYEKKLYKWYVTWLQSQMTETLNHDAANICNEALVLWAVGLAMTNGPGASDRAERFGACLKKVGKSKAKWDYPNGTRWQALFTLDGDKMRDVLASSFREWLTLEPRSSIGDASPDAIELFAKEMGIKPDTHWQVDRTFLELHTLEQLQDLCREWKLPAAKILSSMVVWESCKTRKELVSFIAQHSAKHCTLPKCLQKVKPVFLD